MLKDSTVISDGYGTSISGFAFSRLADLVRRHSGIELQSGNESMVLARLGRRIRHLGHADVSDYLEYIERETGGNEISNLVELLTTHQTAFFREELTLDSVASLLAAIHVRCRRVCRVWSAGCSSGEEPYSLAIICLEKGLSCDDFQILATDISIHAVNRVREAVFEEPSLAGISARRLALYFEEDRRQKARRFRLTSGVARTVSAARLNLMDDWPMAGAFDAILCRNVMIYFGDDCRRRLVERFRRRLLPGALLAVGEAESLGGTHMGMEFLRPAVYREPAARKPLSECDRPRETR